MTSRARSMMAIFALLLGISGLIFGFGLGLQSGTSGAHGPLIILLAVFGGMITWWLGCRLAIPAPRQPHPALRVREGVSENNQAQEPSVVLTPGEILKFAGEGD